MKTDTSLKTKTSEQGKSEPKLHIHVSFQHLHHLLLQSSPNSHNLLVQRQDVRQRADRSDSKGVDLGVAPRVVPLDVLKLRRLLERGDIPVQVAHPPVQRRVPRADVADVALEVLDVDGVEADEGDVPEESQYIQRVEGKKENSQSDVGFSDVGSIVVWAFL